MQFEVYDADVPRVVAQSAEQWVRQLHADDSVRHAHVLVDTMADIPNCYMLEVVFVSGKHQLFVNEHPDITTTYTWGVLETLTEDGSYPA